MNMLVQAIRESEGILDRGFTFLDYNLDPEYLSHHEISIESAKRGQYLSSIGVKKAERVGLILHDNKDFVLWFLGAITAGIVPVPMYPPMPGGRLEGYLDRAVKILMDCEARKVITSQSMSFLAEEFKKRAPTLEGSIIWETIAGDLERFESGFNGDLNVEPEDVCFIQYTSGSTNDPKGVIVTHQNILANVLGIIDFIKLNEKTEMGVCWLPLYHDMGLIGFVLLPTIAHSKNVFMSPLTFIIQPESWIKVISRYRGTISASPNFGLALAAKYASRAGEVDLSCVKSIICGAEPINPNTVRGFINAFRHLGLSGKAVKPAYGMAEATLCVTLNDLEAPIRTLLFERDSYENSGRIKKLEQSEKNKGLEIVSCGRALDGHKVAVLREDMTLAAEGEVGDVAFAGPSITPGYFNNSEATANLFKGEWMITGDLGFILDRELYISGRKKDLIIVAGRNYHPHSVEWCVEQVPGIRPGNVVAFSLPAESTERVVVVSESKTLDALEQLSNVVKIRVVSDIGITVHETVFIEKGSLPKTSSGKLQRAKTKSAFLSGSLKRIDMRL